MNVGHPVQVDLLVIVRDKAYPPILGHLDGPFGQARAAILRLPVHRDEPLRREARLHDGFAAVAFADRQGVVLDANQQSLLIQIV